MVSHPETGSDSPIGSDRDWGRDIHNQHSLNPSSLSPRWFDLLYVSMQSLVP